MLIENELKKCLKIFKKIILHRKYYTENINKDNRKKSTNC